MSQLQQSIEIEELVPMRGRLRWKERIIIRTLCVHPPVCTRAFFVAERRCMVTSSVLKLCLRGNRLTCLQERPHDEAIEELVRVSACC